MKPVGLVSAGVLLLILGAVAPTYARQDQHEEDAKAPKQEQAKPEKQQDETKPVKQEEAKAPKQEEAKPEKQQETKAAPKQEEAKPEEAKAAPKQEEAKPEKQQQAKAAPKQQEAKAVKQPREQEQAKNNQQPQRSAAAEQKQRSEPALRLSARGEGRIPDDRFRSNFGSDHRFHIGAPVMVGGYSRFQYGGYWFGFVEPWPVGWYYTDDVYVNYVDGGYYLYNPYYPDTRVSINVVL